MTHLLAVLAIVLYIVASVLMLVQLWRPSRAGKTMRSAEYAFSLGLVLHSLTMVFVVRDPRFVLVDNGADYFLWVSWGLAVAFALLKRRLNYPLVGAFIVPGIVLFMGSSSYLLHKGSPSVLPDASGLSVEQYVLPLLHAVPALVSVVSLALAFATSCVFLIVERRLKKRRSEALTGFGPNLQLLDLLNKQLAQLGFVAISLVVLSGGLWAVSQQKPVFSADTSVVSGLVTWLLLAFILHVRLVLKWSPKQVSRLTVIVTGSFFVSVFTVLFFAGRLTHVNL
jgi:ABC-type transport system involved in cytochrome c biogenesis permease subunit